MAAAGSGKSWRNLDTPLTSEAGERAAVVSIKISWQTAKMLASFPRGQRRPLLARFVEKAMTAWDEQGDAILWPLIEGRYDLTLPPHSKPVNSEKETPVSLEATEGRFK